MMKNKNSIKGELAFKVICYLALTFFLCIVMYPFLYAFFGSFKESAEILTSSSLLPKSFSLKSFIDAWNLSNFSTYTFNSIWYSALNVFSSVLISTMCGYVFARGNFRGKKVVFAMFSSLMFVALGTSTLYPQLQILKALGLSTSLWGLVVKHFFAVPITNIYIVRGFVESLPKELDEAAFVDGCSFFKTFISIILPLLKPVIATVAIFSFTSSWNDYLMPMIVTLNNPAQRTLSVGMIALKGSSEAATAWNLILAGAMISALPMIIVFLCFNKYFIKGMTTGAVKG